jgi:DNA polymerase III epsilon subunit-like protein
MRKSAGAKTFVAPTPGLPVEDIIRRCSMLKNRFFPKEQPTAIVIIDIETTGLKAEDNWPIELAALFVSGCNGQYDVVQAFHSYLDWTGSKLADPHQFSKQLDQTNAAMLERDPTLRRFNTVELEALGKHPAEVLAGFAELVNAFYAKNSPTFMPTVCGHNALFFDANFLHHTYSRLGMQSPIIGNIIDTGLIVKAAQLTDPRTEVDFNTSLTEWLATVRSIRARVKWSLHEFCYNNFALHRFIPDFVFESKHTALTDCWTVYSMLKLFDLSQEGR